jgi:hypothetical protein
MCPTFVRLSCSTDDRSRMVELSCADRLSKNLAPDPLVEAFVEKRLPEGRCSRRVWECKGTLRFPDCQVKSENKFLARFPSFYP